MQKLHGSKSNLNRPKSKRTRPLKRLKPSIDEKDYQRYLSLPKPPVKKFRIILDFICDICGERFKEPNDLTEHTKEYHYVAVETPESINELISNDDENEIVILDEADEKDTGVENPGDMIVQNKVKEDATVLTKPEARQTSQIVLQSNVETITNLDTATSNSAGQEQSASKKTNVLENDESMSQKNPDKNGVSQNDAEKCQVAQNDIPLDRSRNDSDQSTSSSPDGLNLSTKR